MSVIGEFTIRSDEFVLHRSLTAAPGMAVEIERVVATQEDELVSYFWVTGGDRVDPGDAFRDDPSIRDATRVDEVDGNGLYRAAWTANAEVIVDACTDAGAAILRASGSDGRWSLQLRFDDREGVAGFRTHCRENGIGVELDGLYERDQPVASARDDLTPKQRAALRAALAMGYYDVPQRSTMGELAEEIGISQQAVSKRLHRGHRNLVRSVLTVDRRDGA